MENSRYYYNTTVRQFFHNFTFAFSPYKTKTVFLPFIRFLFLRIHEFFTILRCTASHFTTFLYTTYLSHVNNLHFHDFLPHNILSHKFLFQYHMVDDPLKCIYQRRNYDKFLTLKNKWYYCNSVQFRNIAQSICLIYS